MSANNVVVELRDTEGKKFFVNGIVNGTAEVGLESLQAETRLGDSIEDNEKILRMYLRYLESTCNGNETRAKRLFLEIVKFLNMVRKPIRKIDFYNYSHYLDIRLKRHEKRYHRQMKKSSVNNIIAMLRNFGDFLTLPHVGIMEYNPAQHLKNKIIYKSERYIDESKHLTEEETKQLLMTAKRRNYRDYVLFAIPIFAGTRQGETLALTWDDIDFEKKEIVIRHAKKDKSRRIPMCDTLVKILLEWKKKGIKAMDGSNAVIVTEDGTQMKKSTFYNKIKRYAFFAKIRKRLHPHMLRHTHATLRVKKSDGNMKEIKKLSMDLGHESVAITMDLYVHPNMQDRREAINQFTLDIEA